MPRTKAEVVNLNQHRGNERGELKWESIYDVTSMLQEELFMVIRSGAKIKWIADKVGCSHTTISRLAYGETKEPRASTVLRILTYLGYGVYIR